MSSNAAPEPAVDWAADDHFYENLDNDEYEVDEDRPPDSVLLSLVAAYDWDAALQRIRTNPEECRAKGDEGRKPLHVACDHDAPADVVRALLQAFPDGSIKVGTSNMNPLHITCSSQHASIDVIRVLLEGGVATQTQMVDVDGDTPLHAACRCGAPIEVLEVLLRSNSHAVMERCEEGLTPLLRLWVRYFVILGDDVIQGVKGPGDLTGELLEAWNKTELLLRCAYHGSLADKVVDGHVVCTPFRSVHATAAVDCPRPIVHIATLIHPEQVNEQDQQGLTPLMIACKAPIFKVRDLSDEGYLLEDRIHDGDVNATSNSNAKTANDTSNNNQQEEEASGSAGQPSVIDILLSASTATAAVPDRDGRLPLHVALECGKRWNQGIQGLILSYPDALGLPDVRTNLLPFQLAALGPTADISTVFELVRANPALMEFKSTAGVVIVPPRATVVRKRGRRKQPYASEHDVGMKRASHVATGS